MRIPENIILYLLIAASGFFGLDSVTLGSKHISSNIEFLETPFVLFWLKTVTNVTKANRHPWKCLGW
jgi:hypothetical protein